MRILLLCAVFAAMGLVAFSLAMSGLGAIGNFVVFLAAAAGLLFGTVNLTSAKRAAQASRERAPAVAAEAPAQSSQG
jgi:hypothetical protein